MPLWGYPLLTWKTVCDAVRGMGEYVVEKNLWYKLIFSISENVSAGEAARTYGTLWTETVDPGANQGGTEGTDTAKGRGLVGRWE